jgi:hypothetical protein
VVPLTMAFSALKSNLGPVPAAGLVGTTMLALAVVAVGGLEETFGKDLDHFEK